MKLEKIVTATCVDYAHDGRGVVKIEGMPIFVEDLLLGEEAEIEIIKKENGYYLGRILKLLSISKSRVNPTCENYRYCGGCQLQHMTYDEQLRFKQKRVKEVLKRIAEINIDVPPVLGMDNPWRYRNKVQIPFGKSYDGRLIAGFYQKGTHQIIDMEQSYIEDEDADKVIVTLKKLFVKFRIEPADMYQRTGTIRYVLVRKSKAMQNLMVVFITRTGNFPGLQPLLAELLKRHPNIRTIVQNINPARTTVVLGEQEKVVYGPGFIEDMICGLRFKISSKSFFQVNPIQTEVLYNKAIEFAGLTGKELVYDAYCGVGTIGLIASKFAREVVGVEIVEDAVENAIENAKINGITNTKFICDDATTFMVKMSQEKEKPDVVFIDPPRDGCTPKLIQTLLSVAPKTIVYISCEPSSLARDLKILKQGYQVLAVQPVDMFPQTYHVETVVLLELKTR